MAPPRRTAGSAAAKSTPRWATAQWIQKMQLENAISEKAANSQAIRDKAHQQQRQNYLLGNHVSEYEGIIHEGEKRADANKPKAKELRTSLTLAQTNDNYTQQVEKGCDELEKMNSDLRRASEELEKTWKRQSGQTEKMVHSLEEALPISSSARDKWSSTSTPRL
ncbi:hypothetical protein N7474_007949 [Penicillium riverlandense]|uniref:uncharacterized protein n=1 Tax=Penicillium riverlandense TaxID=1903569 RepID=UPI00254724A5|nr:uncharacterized protein N7474_007949 [Penicillium riverlandense]KAJ5811648.1 hypothetical protein N7474_007949 [Penicillium riverlandense]